MSKYICQSKECIKLLYAMFKTRHAILALELPVISIEYKVGRELVNINMFDI